MFRGSSTPSLAKYARLCAQNDGFVGVHYSKTRYVSVYRVTTQVSDAYPQRAEGPIHQSKCFDCEYCHRMVEPDLPKGGETRVLRIRECNASGMLIKVELFDDKGIPICCGQG